MRHVPSAGGRGDSHSPKLGSPAGVHDSSTHPSARSHHGASRIAEWLFPLWGKVIETDVGG